MSGGMAEPAADPDNYGTLDMDEYMALIEKLFKEANPRRRRYVRLG